MFSLSPVVCFIFCVLINLNLVMKKQLRVIQLSDFCV